jgi:hypothetical protein
MTRSERRRRRQNDRYVDPDTLEDGEVQHTPCHLADAGLSPEEFRIRAEIYAADSRRTDERRAALGLPPYPWARPFVPPPPRQHADVAPTLLAQAPQRLWLADMAYAPPPPPPVAFRKGYLIGDRMRSELTYHQAKHAMQDHWRHGASAPVFDATPRDSASAYYRMRDGLADEWRRHGPPQRSCCSGCAHDGQIAPEGGGNQTSRGPINAWPRKEWPHGGYNDPSSNGGSQWPDPRTLQSQHENDPCTINGAPGSLHQAPDGTFVCVPGRRDQAPSNIAPAGVHPVGGAWPQGGECDLGNGETGLLVKEGDQLVCRPCDYDDAASVSQRKRDQAYDAMCERQRNAWRNW